MTIANVTVTTSEQSSSNPSFSHTPVGGNPSGVLFFTTQVYAGTTVTAVTYGGVSMTEVPGSPHVHSTGEDGQVSAWFLGSSVPTGTQTIAVTAGARLRGMAVYTVTAAGDVEIQDTDVTIDSDSISNPTATLSLGGNSCFCAQSLGAGNFSVDGITPLTNWTDDIETDFGSQVGAVYSFDIIGTADVPMGWTQDADDAFAIGVAIKEIGGGITGSGALASQSATMSGTAELEHTSSGSLISQSATMNGVAELEHTASGAFISQSASMSGTAELEHTASGSLISQSATTSGAGTVGGVITGSGVLASQSATMNGVGEREVTGSGSLQSQSATMNGAAELEHTGSGALASQSATMNGTAEVIGAITATGSLISQSATMTGTAELEHKATGSLISQSATMSGFAFIGGILTDFRVALTTKNIGSNLTTAPITSNLTTKAIKSTLTTKG